MKKPKIFALMTLLLFTLPTQVFAMTANDLHTIQYHDEYYNSTQAVATNCTSGATGGDLDRFIQAIAEQESGGDYLAKSSGSDASGRFQYLTSTWHGSAKQNYPPADAYPTARDAPGPVQDALMYIEYAKKFKQFNGELFKLAISHFYPAANSDPSSLDKIIGNNSVTPRQYANQVIAKINAGSGKNIVLHYTEAPDFAKYLAAAGITVASTGTTATTTPAATSSTCGTNTSGGASGNAIVQKALSLAWPDNHGHAGLDSATPAYKAAWIGTSNMTDCGSFVATVMITSGADPNYPKVGSGNQKAYIIAHPEKYQAILNPSSTTQLQPGDILANGGHTLIYTGPNNGYVVVDASLALHTPGHTPMVNNSGDLQWMLSEPGVVVGRLK